MTPTLPEQTGMLAAHPSLRACRRWPAWLAPVLMLSACASGLSMAPAYVADHPITSPRVPFYRYDDTRTVAVEFVQNGTDRSRYWFVDPARGIATMLSDRPAPTCEFAAPAWGTMFNTFEVRLSALVELPPHYASDDPELVMFARAVPTEIWQKTGPAEGDIGTAVKLDTLVSLDGGRHFSMHAVLLHPAPGRMPKASDGTQDIDYSDVPIRIDKFSQLRFLIVRDGVAYVGLGKVTPTRWDPPPDALIEFLGARIAVFAFDPRSTEAMPRARLLRASELARFTLPNFGPTTHQTDDALLARVRPPGEVSYDEKARRRYVDALRAQFPQWAAQQRIEIGRERFLTTNERLRYVEAARERGDPCATWAVE